MWIDGDGSHAFHLEVKTVLFFKEWENEAPKRGINVQKGVVLKRDAC